MRRIVWVGVWGMVAVAVGLWNTVSWPTYVSGQDKAAAPRVVQVRTQNVGETIYFHVQLESLPDWPPLRWAELRSADSAGESACWGTAFGSTG